jgi:hypothetical protein
MGSLKSGSDLLLPTGLQKRRARDRRRFFVSPHVANALATIGVILRLSLLRISRARSEQNPRGNSQFLDELRRTTQTLRDEANLGLTRGPNPRTGSPFSRYVFRPTLLDCSVSRRAGFTGIHGA